MYLLMCPQIKVLRERLTTLIAGILPFLIMYWLKIVQTTLEREETTWTILVLREISFLVPCMTYRVHEGWRGDSKWVGGRETDRLHMPVCALWTHNVLSTVFRTTKASFWWNSCPKAKPPIPYHTVELWSGKDVPSQTASEASCRQLSCAVQ